MASRSCIRAEAFLLLVLFAGLTAAHAAPPRPEEAQADESLQEILGRLARSAVRYREAALSFACTERITWTERGKGDMASFGYVFVFDEAGGFHDYRTPPRTGPRRKPLALVKPERFGVPEYLASAYLWIFSFRAERQPLHRYGIAGSETVEGRPALLIRFEPVPPFREGVNDWFGTAWVDQETAQLLKVEAYSPADWAALEKADRRRREIVRITTVFSVERHGMRFPGHVELRRERHERLPDRRAGPRPALTRAPASSRARPPTGRSRPS